MHITLQAVFLRIQDGIRSGKPLQLLIGATGTYTQLFLYIPQAAQLDIDAMNGDTFNNAMIPENVIIPEKREFNEAVNQMGECTDS